MVHIQMSPYRSIHSLATNQVYSIFPELGDLSKITSVQFLKSKPQYLVCVACEPVGL